MNSQQKFWNAEYRDSQLVTKSFEPQADVLRFIQWLRREEYVALDETKTILDLGCGVGRNAIYFAQHYTTSSIGYDFSSEAIKIGEEYIAQNNIKHVVLEVRSIAETYPLAEASVDIVLDVTASNSLSSDERNVYLQEVARVLKPGGYFFVRALTRDGDRNAQNLLSLFPGQDYDTYIHPDLGIAERVFREEDFRELYGLYFDVKKVAKQTGYQQWKKGTYKRRYLVAYLQKKSDILQ